MCWWAKNTAAGYVPDISISFEMCIFLIAVNESLEELKKKEAQNRYLKILHNPELDYFLVSFSISVNTIFWPMDTFATLYDEKAGLDLGLNCLDTTEWVSCVMASMDPTCSGTSHGCSIDMDQGVLLSWAAVLFLGNKVKKKTVAWMKM